MLRVAGGVVGWYFGVFGWLTEVARCSFVASGLAEVGIWRSGRGGGASGVWGAGVGRIGWHGLVWVVLVWWFHLPDPAGGCLDVYPMMRRIGGWWWGIPAPALEVLVRWAALGVLGVGISRHNNPHGS